MRVESIWRQVIVVYRGGILADWYVLCYKLHFRLFAQVLCVNKFRHRQPSLHRARGGRELRSVTDQVS